jgi:hypothetical protein
MSKKPICPISDHPNHCVDVVILPDQGSDVGIFRGALMAVQVEVPNLRTIQLNSFRAFWVV